MPRSNYKHKTPQYKAEKRVYNSDGELVGFIINNSFFNYAYTSKIVKHKKVANLRLTNSGNIRAKIGSKIAAVISL